MILSEAKQQAKVARSVWDNPALPAALREVCLADKAGKLRNSNVLANGLGYGPILDPEVIAHFAQLDTTQNLSVLRWMLFQAGGGSAALRDSNDKLELCKTLFMRERQAGRGEGGAAITPMSSAEAEAAWNTEEPVFRNAFFPGDEDMLLQNSGAIFGYARFWPGYENVYEKVFEEVKTFLDNVSGRVGGKTRLSLINQARRQRAAEAGVPFEPVSMDLKVYPTLEAVHQVNEEFLYFFKRQAASKDIQFIGRHPEKQEYSRGSGEKFYEDDYIVAYVPATAAAMMKVGFDNWCVANKSEFERAFAADSRLRTAPHWTGYAQSGPFMVIHPKVDMGDENIRRIAVYMPRDLCDIPNLAEPYEGVQFFDKVNRNHPRPVDWPELSSRLKNPMNFANGAAIGASIKAALDHFVAWAQQMRDDEIKSSVYEAMAAVLVYDLLYS